MAVLRPFRAIRPAKEYAEKVVSLPYDVMNRQEAAEMAKGKPYSYLHICRAEIDLPAQKNPYHPEVYKKAKANIADFLNKGVFIREDAPAYYVYRQIMQGRTQTGLVGCASIDEYQNDTIKKHEKTRHEKEIDRINHFDICNADTEPVFFTYKDNADLAALMAKVTEREPEYDITDDQGVQHILWVVSDPAECDEIEKTIAEKIPYFYIADGHHRSASAVKVGLARREQHPDYTGDEEFNYFMAVIFPDTDLRIFDYNRVVRDTNGLGIEGMIDAIKNAGFIVEKVGKEPYAPQKKHEFGMYAGGEWYRLSATGKIIPEGLIESFDVSILQNSLLDPVLGIKDPRTDKRIDFVGGIRGLGELERRASSDMELAFSVYPVSMEDLMKVADAGLVMPPKSTWFEPKLLSGLFIHYLS